MVHWRTLDEKQNTKNKAVHAQHQACSQDVLWEGGGGCVPQEPGTNILMFEQYAMQVPKIQRAEWRT